MHLGEICYSKFLVKNVIDCCYGFGYGQFCRKEYKFKLAIVHLMVKTVRKWYSVVQLTLSVQLERVVLLLFFGPLRRCNDLRTTSSVAHKMENILATSTNSGDQWRCNSLYLFLDASSHLYKRVCPSVGRSVRPSVGRSVRRSVTSYFLFSKMKGFLHVCHQTGLETSQKCGIASFHL